MQAPETQSAFAERVDDGVERDPDMPGDHRTNSSITCVLTRFRLRHATDLLATRRDYHEVVAGARQTSGLLASAFLVENVHTCFSLSIWDSPRSIPKFGTNVPAHIPAARRVFGRARVDPDGGAEVWSTKWSLRSFSNNLSWGGFDLSEHLTDPDRSRGRRG